VCEWIPAQTRLARKLAICFIAQAADFAVIYELNEARFVGLHISGGVSFFDLSSDSGGRCSKMAVL
jgi:hypothetical protein